MPNIFDGLEKLDNNTIRENIAMLEAINMGNVIKGYGTTIANKGAKLINGIGGFFWKNLGVTVKEEKRLDDYIKDKRYEIRNLSRNELNLRLKEDLIEKIDCISNTDDVISITDDVISAGVINSVANYMKLGENMTVAQKADGIHRRYLEKMLNIIQKKLKDQDSIEANKTINEIEKNINNLSENDKAELKKVLNLNKLTGNEIRNVLMKAGTPALIMGALSASGFGAFVALTTVMHAIFTTILGITVPFAVYTGATSVLSVILGPVGLAFVAGTTIWQIKKGNKNLKNEIMGQIVFSAVSSNGGSFVAKNEDLPSYEDNPEILEKIRKMDEEYNKLIEENNRLYKEVYELENRYKESKENIKTYKKKIEEEKLRRENSEKEIIRLKDEKESVANNLEKSAIKIARLEKEISIKDDEELRLELEKSKSLNNLYEEELEELNKSISDQNFIIEEAAKEIDKKIALIKENEDRNIELQKENEVYKKEIERKDKEIQKTEKIRKKKILEKWNVYYPKFEFTTSAIRDAVKFFEKEIWEIERALIELHSTNDYKSLSRGKIKEEGVEYEHMGFSLPCGFPTRILYGIINNSNKKVIIEKIYKHNEKIYQ